MGGRMPAIQGTTVVFVTDINDAWISDEIRQKKGSYFLLIYPTEIKSEV